MAEAKIKPSHIAMLVQGNEEYGIGTIEKLYALDWPELTFICLERGHMYDWLISRNCRVELVEGLASFRERNSFTTLAKMPWILYQARRDAARIDERLRGREIRIVHAHWRPQQLIAGYMRSLGYRAVWQINNNTSHTRMAGLGLALNHRIAKWGADLLLPASDFIAANWRGCKVPMKTIRNAAVPIFDAPNSLPTDGPVRCLVAGRLVASKGHHHAVEAIIAARKAGCDVTLDLFGGPTENNSYVDELQKKIRTAGIERFIRFTGFCDDLRRRHSDYHLGFQCRIDPEPCSLWVCETLVDGLPLLASASGGTPELVEDGITGYLYPPGSVEVLARRLIELCQDRKRLARMRQAAFERGQKHFTVTRFLAETLDAYAALGLQAGE